MANIHSDDVYILYFIMPNGHVVMVGAYSTEADANRASTLVLNARPQFKQEGVTGPHIEKIPFNDFFIGDDNFVDIEAK